MRHDITGVFFDWDGTLVDSLKFLHLAHNHVRVHFGLPIWSMDEFKGNMKYSSLQLYPKIYGDQTNEALEVLKAFIMANHLHHLELIDGAVQLLDRLNAANIPMGVVSNKRHMFVVREVEHLGWSHYFKAVVGAGEAGNDKPDSAPLVLALGRAGLSPGPHILYVGDTVTDLECADNTGCRAGFLYHENPQNPLISKHNPEIAVKNCIDLAAALFPH